MKIEAAGGARLQAMHQPVAHRRRALSARRTGGFPGTRPRGCRCVPAASGRPLAITRQRAGSIARQRDNQRRLAGGVPTRNCLGALLAQLVGRVFFETLLERIPEIELLDPRPASTAASCCAASIPGRFIAPDGMEHRSLVPVPGTLHDRSPGRRRASAQRDSDRDVGMPDSKNLHEAIEADDVDRIERLLTAWPAVSSTPPTGRLPRFTGRSTATSARRWRRFCAMGQISHSGIGTAMQRRSTMRSSMREGN